MSTREHFERHILKGDGCWLWTGATNNKGYPQFGQDGRTRSAHRVAYEFYVGPIPEGAQVDHTCHNADEKCPGGTECRHRRCVNPSHLEAVTAGENNRRRFRDKCPKGHAFTPENTGHRRDDGRRYCLTCKRVQAQKKNIGYGKRGRPTNAEREAMAERRLREAS